MIQQQQGHRLRTDQIFALDSVIVKDLYSCPTVAIIQGLTDKEQFQHLTGLKGPQEGTTLYTTAYLSLR